MSKRNKNRIMQQTDLYEEARRRYQEIIEVKQEKEVSVAKSLPGKIHIASTKDRTQFYLRKSPEEKTGRYISKSDKTRLKAYIQKDYDEKVIKLLDKEERILGRFLKGADYTDCIQRLYSDNTDEVKAFIAPVDITDEDYKKAWMNMQYRGKEISDYVQFYKTNRKERVRSKSELNIANALAAKGIPYKYECPLDINGICVYPDFTVLNVRKRKQIYWEHRGMMDDKDYARNSVMKIKMYMKNGIFVGRNLIITEETSANPLGTDEIEAVIREYFINV
ncbi:MAG: hypothetical protein K5686_05925 [Lachnospiraceae bacterium]|nr:hypothetical protein [Lachnospiraceae bacterium]